MCVRNCKFLKHPVQGVVGNESGKVVGGWIMAGILESTVQMMPNDEPGVCAVAQEAGHGRCNRVDRREEREAWMTGWVGREKNRVRKGVGCLSDF